MADTFFGFEADLPALGAGKYDTLETFLTDEVEEEEEYDALNDETFGADLNVAEDWENAHEKLAKLAENHKEQFQNKSHNETDGALDLPYESREDAIPEKHHDYDHDRYQFAEDGELEQSLSQLVLEDDLDDPAIMGASKSQPILMRRDCSSLFGSSPPPPAIIASDHVGSPSTKTIWTSPQRVDHTPPDRVSALLSSMRNVPSRNNNIEDSSILTIGKEIPYKSPLPHILPNARTVDEIERELLSSSPVLSSARHLEEVEREILLKPRALTLNEIEREIMGTRGSPNAGGSLHSGVSNIPPGLSKQDHFGSSGQPILSGGFRSDRRSSPIPIDVGLCVSPPSTGVRSLPKVSPHHHPTLGMSHLQGPLMVQPYLGRLVPPQVAAFQRPSFLGQPLINNQMRFPVGVPGGGRISPPMTPFGSAGSRFPMQVPFPDSQKYCRFTPPHGRQPFNNAVNTMERQRRTERRRNERNDGFPSRSHTNSESETDEYANLMTQKEKDWLIKIQIMQLQSSNPYLDDYYFTQYMLKKKLAEKQRKGNGSGDEPKLLLPELNKTESKAYTPAQFEGSLGKLQAISVYYPRKIIDLVVMHPENGDNETTIANRDLRRFRQVLLEIEKLYTILLEIEDSDKKMAALPENAHEPLKESKANAVMSVYNSLSSAMATEDKFALIMSTRKGKNLVLRIYPLLSKDQKQNILLAILRNWTPIMKRDLQDQIMLRFYQSLYSCLSSGNLATVVEMGRALQNHPPEGVYRSSSPTHQKSHYAAAFQHKMGMIFICHLLNKAEQLYQEMPKQLDPEIQTKWSKVILHIVDTLCYIPDNSLVKPVEPVPNLLVHFQRFPIERQKYEILESKLQLLKAEPGSGDAS